MVSINPQNKQNPSIVTLFLSFFRLGLTAFGGPAMVAYINKMAVEKHKWLDEATFKDGVVICQSVPGSTAMQTAAYVGLRVRNVIGALATYIGFGLPAFVLMLILSEFYVSSHNLPKVISLFSGLQVIVVAIVARAAFSFGKSAIKSYPEFFITAISGILLWIGISPFIVIFVAALAGIMLFKRSDTSKAFSHVKKDPQFFRHLAVIISILFLVLAGLYLLDKELFKLTLLMFRIDLFAFGGGFAALPLMLHEVVGVRGWMDSKTFMDGIALGQVTPGPITMSTTFVGYLLRGFPGAIVATLAIFTPSFLMVVFVTPVFDKLKSSPYFLGVTRAIYASFVGLLCFVTVKFAFAVPWNTPKVLLGIIALIALLKDIDILYVVLTGAIISIFVF